MRSIPDSANQQPPVERGKLSDFFCFLKLNHRQKKYVDCLRAFKKYLLIWGAKIEVYILRELQNAITLGKPVKIARK